MGNPSKINTPPFHLVSTVFPQVINKLAHGHVSALLVLTALEDCSNYLGACVVSEYSIGKCIKRSTMTVQNAIRYLRVNGYIKVFLVKGRNLYVLNPNLLWHTYNQTRYKIAHNLHFQSAYELTRKRNNGYYHKHRELERNNDTRHYSDLINEIIDDESKIQAKVIRHTNDADIVNRIKGLILSIHFTHREKQFVKFLIKKLPKVPNIPLEVTNKDLLHMVNKDVKAYNEKLPKNKQQPKMGYTTVAHATTKLRQHDIIIRHHNSIEFNPMFLPFSKESFHY